MYKVILSFLVSESYFILSLRSLNYVNLAASCLQRLPVELALLVHLLKCHAINPLTLVLISHTNASTDLCMLVSNVDA